MYAIATFVMNGAEYVPGAVCLAKSIRRFHQDIDLICMVTEDVSLEELEKWYNRVVIVDPICVEAPNVGGKRATTKWHILQFEEYEKVLFIDADMIVVNPIDQLFLLQTPAAVFDHQISQEYCSDPRWIGRFDDQKSQGFINWYKVALGLETRTKSYSHLEHGTLIPSNAIGNLLKHSNNQFSLQGGMVLVTPNKQYHSEFLSEAQSIVDSLYKPLKDVYVRTDRTLSAVDELLICIFLHLKGHQWRHIDITYNVVAYHLYNIYRDSKYYISPYKPWNTRPDGQLEIQIGIRHINYMLKYVICGGMYTYRKYL